MDLTDRSTAVGVFVDRSHAEYALDELQRAGFGPEQIGFVVPDAPAGVEAPAVPAGSNVGKGAAVGATAGVALGVLVGAALSNVVLPGVGPVLFGGLLAGALGATAGAAGGGVLGALIGLNVPEHEARHYEREFHSGRTLVTVRADGRYGEAAAILRRAEQYEPEPHAHGRPRLAALEGGGDEGEGAGSANVPRM